MSTQNHHKQSNILTAFWLNLAFAFVELVGAFFTNSVAIASDALHDLGDGLSIGLSWYLERFSTKSRDHLFSFGYKRFSLLAAVINCLILIFGSLFILRETIPRFFNPPEIHPEGMIVLAIVGIVMNGLAAFRLHHGHSINESILSLHFLEDVLGWISVLIVAIAIQFGNYAFLDPLLSLAISLWLIWNASKRLKRTVRIFLQSTPEGLEIEPLEQSLRQYEAVLGVHDTHVWSLDGQHHVLSTHLLITPGLKPQAINALKNQIKRDLSAQGIQHVTLELECEGDVCY